MGINKFSLYSEFESKYDLFLAALDKYRREVADDFLSVLATVSGLAGLRAFFDAFLRRACVKGEWRGCLLANTVFELAPRDQEAVFRSADFFAKLQGAFRRHLRFARERGEIPPEADVETMVHRLSAFLLGLNTMGKILPDRDALLRLCEAELATLTVAPPPPEHVFPSAMTAV
jgi:TetR/AcrR family transcriptional repressor of nem operon